MSNHRISTLSATHPDPSLCPFLERLQDSRQSSVQCFINLMSQQDSFLVVVKHCTHELLCAIWVDLSKLHLERKLKLYPIDRDPELPP